MQNYIKFIQTNSVQNSEEKATINAENYLEELRKVRIRRLEQDIIEKEMKIKRAKDSLKNICFQKVAASFSEKEIWDTLVIIQNEVTIHENELTKLQLELDLAKKIESYFA